MTDNIPATGGARVAKLASVPVGHAGRRIGGWGRRMLGQDQAEIQNAISEKTAEQLFEVLGALKGGAMKLGQVLSVLEPAMPIEFAEPYRRALTKMQSSAPPLPSRVMYRVLDEQLGSRWRERFTAFDDVPVAAASIGQVYRATYHDGRPVAVKVQYPGADEAVRTDLRQVRRIRKMLQPFLPGTDLEGAIEEVCERIAAELDYRDEADNQRRFWAAFADDDQFVVPKVVASSPKVLVQEWVEGTPLAEVVSDGDKELRDHTGRLIAEFFYAGIARTGLLHSDPHPGNYRLCPDGRLGILDYGAVSSPPPEAWEATGRLYRAAVDGAREDLVALARETGYLVDPDADPDELFAFATALVEPMTRPTFHFTRAWMRQRVGPLMATRSAEQKVSRSLTPPKNSAMLHRVFGGLWGLLCQLDAEIPFQSIVERWHPGFQPHPTS
ncbi:MAG TPA: AarF/ABC1/UbiB kinase family protein [Pseudonocardia sp.]|jgi:predicted unusual protein kinase regulating ubiquinone biosynthesis (AarF/ABC1/UbiB family)|nr:AarF/ABC1/UbiB kinase family protein [Pseudonocardia sp.]